MIPSTHLLYFIRSNTAIYSRLSASLLAHYLTVNWWQLSFQKTAIIRVDSDVRIQL